MLTREALNEAYIKMNESKNVGTFCNKAALNEKNAMCFFDISKEKISKIKQTKDRYIESHNGVDFYLFP